ncbi:MAG: glutamate racemase [Alphaproteobacteria bacterium]|uniref:Glutamate racemase n=1 Tax=Candidatus Nitrobium versatile TaxID=2884831 RepID=A0A953M2P7_9BACT|nr:glutamate racemase [Candidatus Nitrobium versatile]
MKTSENPIENSIGIFDSGIGGLTVLKEVRRLLPEEHIIYLGDTARVPYGIRSPETVLRYSFECTEFLMQQKIKLLVIACNTVSATSLAALHQKLPIPVVGVIEPGARAAVHSTKCKRIGIIGTEATIKSSAYLKAITSLDRDIEVFGLACPLFVPLVEEGWTEGEIARMIGEKYLGSMRDKGTDTLVLGCTHYPLLKSMIQEVMGDITLIDSAVETAKTVAEVLVGNGMLRRGEEPATDMFYVTDSPEKFVAVGERFLQRKIGRIERIKL